MKKKWFDFEISNIISNYKNQGKANVNTKKIIQFRNFEHYFRLQSHRES